MFLLREYNLFLILVLVSVPNSVSNTERNLKVKRILLNYTGSL
jgi:hypothetical protein